MCLDNVTLFEQLLSLAQKKILKKIYKGKEKGKRKNILF